MSTLTTAGITFGDATSQTTAATAAALVTTTNVLNATAGASAGAVGTYALLRVPANSPGYSFGSTRAGSGLVPSTTSSNASGSVSGTWRCMGYINPSCAVETTLWLRIS